MGKDIWQIAMVLWSYKMWFVSLFLLGLLLQRKISRLFTWLPIAVVSFLLLGLFCYWQFTGLAQIKDIRAEFENSQADTNRQSNIGSILSKRNEALHKIGYCMDGDWWISKPTGEPFDLTTDTAIYYPCSHYGF